MTNPDLGTWSSAARAQLQARSDYPSIEVTVIASHVLQKPKEWIIAHPELILNDEQVDALERAIDRMMKGEPLAYITGKRSFYGLDLMVDRRVLVPRPETELLVDLAIDWLMEHPGKVRVVDIGTGSGAIAIALACRFPLLHVSAIDASIDALAVARANAHFHHVENRVSFIHNNLLKGLSNQFDLILANLPYIPTPDLDNLPALEFEPRAALDGGFDGLEVIETLIGQCEKNLAQNGCVILEIQYNQGNAIQEIALKQYPQANISIHQDLAALPRVVKIQM